MPNYCNNNLQITCQNSKDLQTILEKYFTQDKNESGDWELDCELIVPTPKTKESCDPNCLVTPKSYIQLIPEKPWFDWYEWNRKYWGSKWNAFDQYSEVWNDARVFGLSFLTAWTPLEPVIRQLVKLIKAMDIEFELHYAYYESGCWFAGSINYDSKKDQLIEKECDSDLEIVQLARDEGFDDCEWVFENQTTNNDISKTKEE